MATQIEGKPKCNLSIYVNDYVQIALPTICFKALRKATQILLLLRSPFSLHFYYFLCTKYVLLWASSFLFYIFFIHFS